MQFLQHYRDQLRQLVPNSPETRELTALAQDRRQLVEQRVALANRMMSYLKAYFPTILELKPARAYSEFVVRLDHAYPTLEDAQKAGKVKLRKILFGTGAKAKMEVRLETIMQAKPITTDPVILRTNARRSRSLAAQIDVLNDSIKHYDAEIKELVKKHADYEEQLAKGKTAQMAKRALAFKWIRIIFRLWQARVGYDDSHYVSRLNKTGSPLAKKLQTVET